MPVGEKKKKISTDRAGCERLHRDPSFRFERSSRRTSAPLHRARCESPFGELNKFTEMSKKGGRKFGVV